MFNLICAIVTDPLSLVLLAFAAVGIRLVYTEVKHSYHKKLRQQKIAARYAKELDAWKHASGEIENVDADVDSTMDGVTFYEEMADFMEKDPKFAELFPNYGGYDAYPSLQEPNPINTNTKIDDFFDQVTDYAMGLNDTIFGEDAPEETNCEITLTDIGEVVEEITAINSFSETLHSAGFHQKLQELLNDELHVDAENDREAGV